MISNFKIALDVVFPIFCFISIGYIIQRLQVVERNVFMEMNKLVFKLFLPVVVFKNIINSKIEESFNVNLIVFCILAILIIVVVAMLLVQRIEKDTNKKSVMVLAMFRSNFALFGLPIVLSLYQDIGITSIMIATLIPLLNVLGVVVLEYYRGSKINILRIMTEIMRNPLIIGALLGLFFLFFKLNLPFLIDGVVEKISEMATPMALIVLGGLFQFHRLFKNIKQITIVLLMRLVIIPFVVLAVAVLLGYRGLELVSIMVLFGSPVAVSVSPMTMAMKGDYELACQVVFMSSIFAIFTVFLWVFIFQTLRWL